MIDLWVGALFRSSRLQRLRPFAFSRLESLHERVLRTAAQITACRLGCFAERFELLRLLGRRNALLVLFIDRGMYSQGDLRWAASFLHKPSLAIAEEFSELRGLAGGELLGQSIECLTKGESRAVNQAVSSLQVAYVVCREPGPTETETVEADDHRGRAIGEYEGRYVLYHLGAPPHHRQSTNAAKLVYSSVAAQAGSVSYGDMSAQHNTIGQDDVVPNLAVVGNVGPDHHQAVIPDRGKAFAMHSSVNRDVLADGVAVANSKLPWLLDLPYVLWETPQNRTFTDLIVFSQTDAALHRDICTQPRAVANDCIFFHNRKGANRYIVAKSRSWVDQCGWVNHQAGPFTAAAC